MIDKDMEAAAALPLFEGLDQCVVERLLAQARVLRCRKGDLIAMEGQAAESVFILLRGSVELFTLDTKESTLMLFAPPHTFMVAAAVLDEPHLASIRALKQCTLLELGAAAVRQESARCPVFAHRLLVILASQFRLMLRHLKDDRIRSGPQRLAAYLLHVIDKEGNGPSAELPYSKGIMASRLGMTAETLSRSLQTLSRNGIALRGHRVVLVDRAKAELFCRPDPLIDEVEEHAYARAW